LVRQDNGGPDERPADEPVVDFQDVVAAAEAAVERGATSEELASLGYFRVLKQIKSSPQLSGHWAEQLGRIDRARFERATRIRLPVWFGNLVSLVGIAAGAVAAVIAIDADDPVVAGLALVASAGIWTVAVHALAHWLVGRIVGIRFLCYFVGGPLKVTPGVKTDYATYLRTPPGSRAVMHASGAIASKVAPFVSLAIGLVSGNPPSWSLWAVGAIGVVQILTDVLWSTKKSDWKKVRRERAVARAWEAAPSR
jgi:hypothetical protein